MRAEVKYVQKGRKSEGKTLKRRLMKFGYGFDLYQIRVSAHV